VHCINEQAEDHRSRDNEERLRLSDFAISFGKSVAGGPLEHTVIVLKRITIFVSLGSFKETNGNAMRKPIASDVSIMNCYPPFFAVRVSEHRITASAAEVIAIVLEA
jgi:hypothetical protein